MPVTPHRRWALATPLLLPLALLCAVLLATTVAASPGDRLPEFQTCVEVCIRENCRSGTPTHIPLHRRLLLWSCPAECDHACQNIVTTKRVASALPVLQFHGKWPFTRMLGLQEPLSVLFSLGNLYAHVWGLAQLRESLPRSYTLLPFYEALGRLGIATWACSAAFHARDLAATEQADYLAAGASVMYGLYYAAVRVFRLDRPTARRRSVLHAWTLACLLAYLAHVLYLKGWAWNYTYNMVANVVVGVAQNALWSYFSWSQYRRLRRPWAAWPGVVVAWVMMAMSLELFDFPPLFGILDAHSLWHLGTIGPAVIMYNFLIRDGREIMAGEERLHM